MTPAGVTLTGTRAACGLAFVCRHSMLDRLQGSRMLLQAAAEAWARGSIAGRSKLEASTLYTAATIVDALHSFTMLAFAAPSEHRRHGLSSAATALGFVTGDLLVLGTTAQPPRPDSTVEA